MEEISCDDIQNLMHLFSKKTYRAKDSEPLAQEIMQKCVSLISMDYEATLIDNSGGDLSAHYPSQLIILENEKSDGQEDSFHSNDSSPVSSNNEILNESTYDVSKLKDLFFRARSARCRARFPLPVILFRGKHICRSSTLSGGPEMYGRQSYEYFFCYEDLPQDADELQDQIPSSENWHLFDKVRNHDIRLLKTLNVSTIIDFMVEKKKVKFGLNVSSSEKVDKENRYSEFTLISLPYPGCEFFKEFRDNDYVGQGLVFDWSQGHVDAAICIPNDSISSTLRIDWEKYKEWDLIVLTENYMRLVLRYVTDDPLGMLIHCISGWDRTPLFISLLRLSLWADGAIHKSLSPTQILYLTIAYDWMLFGHNLYDRLNKGEDIFLFCFYFLKFILGEEYSIHRLPAQSKNGSVFRTDSDPNMEGVLLENEAPISSQGSNVSLHSSWSSISSKAHETSVFFPCEDLSASHSNTSIMSNMSIYNFKTDCPDSPSSLSDAISPQNSNSSSNGSDNGFESPMSSESDQKTPNGSPDSNGKLPNACKTLPNRTSPVAVPSNGNSRSRNESTSSLSTGSWQFVTGTGSFRGSGSTSICSCIRNSTDIRSTENDNRTMEDSTTTLKGDCPDYNRSLDRVTQRSQNLNSVRNLFYNSFCSSVGYKLKDGSDASSLGGIIGTFAGKVRLISSQRPTV